MTTHFTAIYCDLDGVLVDFAKTALAITGYLPEHLPHDKAKRREFWTSIERHVKAGHKFFEAMDPIPDSRDLWDYLMGTGIPVYICSATGHIKGAADEKRAWVARHLGERVACDAIFVRDAVNKAAYASDTTILVDDRRKAIDPWIATGGTGVLHTSAIDSIAQLKALGV